MRSKLEYKQRNIKELVDSDIFYNTVQTPIDTIITRLDSGYYLIPKYQRNYIWNPKQVVALIISIIKGIPIPRLYMYHDADDGRHTVIDGQQRLTSLYFYIKGVFPKSLKKRVYYDFQDINNILKNMQTDKQSSSENKELLFKKYGLVKHNFIYEDFDENNYTDINFSDFDQRTKLEFLNKTFDLGLINVFDENKRRQLKTYTDIFMLLNSAGEPLSNQEIRNGVYHTNPVYLSINEFNSTNEAWLNIKPNDNNREKSSEFLFRLLSLDYFYKFDLENQSIYLQRYTGKYSDLIDKFSEELNNVEDASNLAKQCVYKLKNYFKGITNIPHGETIDILNLESFYVVSSKLNKLNENFKIEYKTLIKLKKSTSSTASTNEINNRILSALELVGENFVSKNNSKKRN